MKCSYARFLEITIVAMFFVGCGVNTPNIKEFGKGMSFAMDISNRKPISNAANTSASDIVNVGMRDHYAAVGIKEGAEVAFSAAYGTEGEAGQSRGVVVRQWGGLYYKPESNPTSQLLLPPGLPFNSSETVSRWELTGYATLAKTIAFGQNSYTNGKHTTYDNVSAAKVDFEAGTAGASFRYSDALEVVMSKESVGDTKSEVAMYFARDIGLVALEFRESGLVSGVFKVYFGQ